jgi:hypothetical protein
LGLEAALASVKEEGPDEEAAAAAEVVEVVAG